MGLLDTAKPAKSIPHRLGQSVSLGFLAQTCPVLENVFVPPPTNFGQKVPPKARNREKADFATKVRNSSINHVNVNHEQ